MLGLLVHLAAASFHAPGVAWHRQQPRTATPTAGLLDDMLSSARENFREVTVQHILVSRQADALELYDAIREEGATAENFGRYAASKSTCGSAKKRPDAKLQMLRGQPGELKFRRGSMAKEFEEAAFSAAPGTLVPPFQTSFGWHVMLVNG